jgi:hypothetical protein
MSAVIHDRKDQKAAIHGSTFKLESDAQAALWQ